MYPRSVGLGVVKMAGVTMVGVKGGVYTRRCFETEGVACLTEQAGGAGWSGVRKRRGREVFMGRNG